MAANTDDQLVTILVNGEPSIAVTLAQLVAGHAATMARPSLCGACFFFEPQHAPDCRAAGRVPAEGGAPDWD